jgi:DNA-binding MarR family transcriptional regulator
MRLLLEDWPGANAPAPLHLVTATRRFSRHIQRRLDNALDGCGISYAQLEVLWMLDERPRVHGAELARRFRVTRQTVTGLHRQLERADLIVLTPPDWARGGTVTPLGKKRLQLGLDAITPEFRKIAALDPATRRQLLDCLQKLDWALRDPPRVPW